MRRLRSLVFLAIATLLLAVPHAAAQNGKSKRLKRTLVGAEMEFGRKAAMSGLWNEAIFRWEKVIAAQPDNPDALNNLAVAYESVGAYEKAGEYYERALSLDEDSQAIRRNLKRFKSFFRKHRRQIERDQKIKARERAEEAVKAENNERGEGNGGDR